MKKLLRILILGLSMTLLFGCVRDEAVTENPEVTEKPQVNEVEKENIIIEESDIVENDALGNNTVENNNIHQDKIIYKDDIYGFALELPKSWEGKYTIEKKLWIDEISDSIEFNYKKDDISTNIFTIIIMNESIQHEDWQELFLMYIVENDGKTFSYLNVMEPTEELLMEENKEELEMVTNMVQEVPFIIETFSFIK